MACESLTYDLSLKAVNKSLVHHIETGVEINHHRDRFYVSNSSLGKDAFLEIQIAL